MSNRTFNDMMYDRWMDAPILKDEYVTLPCGHTVDRWHLAAAGGLCPTCEMDKDQKELGNWPRREILRITRRDNKH